MGFPKRKKHPELFRPVAHSVEPKGLTVVAPEEICGFVMDQNPHFICKKPPHTESEGHHFTLKGNGANG